MKKEIKPFNDFWMNCDLNSDLSLIIEKEPSYIIAAYENSYNYYLYDETPILTSGIDVERNNLYKLLNGIIKKNEIRVESENKADYIKIIKNALHENKVVGALVDLFEWLPDTIVYHKKHWFHYTTIIDFDNQSRQYTILDEDYNGFNLHIISENKLFNSLLLDKPDAPIYICMLADEIVPYKFNVNKILSNAEDIIERITILDEVDTIWKDQVEDQEQSIKIIIASTSRLFNCQLGNIHLIDYMYKNRFITKEMNQKFQVSLNEIRCKWNFLHNSVLKCDIKNSFPKCSELNKSSHYCLRKEAEFWHELIDIL